MKELVLITLVAVVIISGCIEQIAHTNTITNFKDFNENPNNYIGKNITISGKYVNYFIPTDVGNLHGLKDNEDYVIYFSPEYSRDFEDGKYYTISGTVVTAMSAGGLIFGNIYYVLKECTIIIPDEVSITTENNKIKDANDIIINPEKYLNESVIIDGNIIFQNLVKSEKDLNKIQYFDFFVSDDAGNKLPIIFKPPYPDTSIIVERGSIHGNIIGVIKEFDPCYCLANDTNEYISLVVDCPNVEWCHGAGKRIALYASSIEIIDK